MAQKLSNLANKSKVKFGSLYGSPIVWIVADKMCIRDRDKGISVPSADVTATGISLTGHTHTDSMGGGTSGPQ